MLAHKERADDISASVMARKLPLGLVSYAGQIGDNPTIEQLIKEPVTDVDLPKFDDSASAFIFFNSSVVYFI